MMQFIFYPKCTTCQKAKKWLDEHGLDYTPRDIKLDRPSYEELKDFVRQSGLPIKKFFNTSGLLYREQGLSEKLPSLTEEEQLRLLASDGMLVKRPLLIGNGKVLVGFREDAWSALL